MLKRLSVHLFAGRELLLAVLELCLRILIQAPEVPFLVPPKKPKWPIFGVLGVPKMALRVP